MINAKRLRGPSAALGCALAMLAATLGANALGQTPSAGKAAPRAAAVKPVFPKPANTIASPITVGRVVTDGATTETLSLFLPVTGGDTDDDSVATVQYRQAGTTPWKQALDLYKNHKTQTAPFAGMIFGLKPDTDYEVRVDVQDPDGVKGLAEQTVTLRTRAIPPVIRAGPANTVRVATTEALNTAIKNATPGQVILLAPGTYQGTIRIYGKKGTKAAPITIRGTGDFKSVITGGGKNRVLMIEESDYIHIEHLHLTDGPDAIDVRNWSKSGTVATVGNVIRNNRMSKVTNGIRAVSDGPDRPAHRYLYIADNVLEGNHVFGDTSKATWNDKGIVIVAESSEVAYNTLSGFGDSLGFTRDQSRAVDFHHNKVLYGGDDGIEMDFGYRNVVARENLFSNTGDGVSFQYIIEGPGYAFKNLIYNVLPGRGPFKIKPEAECNSGVFVLANSSVNGGRALTNFSACGTDFFIVDNLFTGDKADADIVRLDSSQFHNLTWSHNAFIYDGKVQFSDFYSPNFSGFKATARGAHDVLIDSPVVFRKASLLPQDPAGGLGVERSVDGMDFRLAAGSAAIGAGKVLPNINDGFAGAAPDIGAFQSNQKPTQWGARPYDRERELASEVDPDLRPSAAKETEVPPINAAAATATAGAPAAKRIEFDGAIDAVPAGHWAELKNTHMLSVVPAAYKQAPIAGVLGPPAIMLAWGGGAYDTRRDRLLVWGGGHTDYAGNEVYAFDVSERKWHRLTDASNPPARNAEATADGKPVSRHTYGGITYFPNLDSLFGHGGSRFEDGNATTGTWLLNLADNQWERKGDEATGAGYSTITAYDPSTGTALQVAGGLMRYDPKADKWDLLSKDDGGTYGRYGTFDTKRKQFLYLGNKGAFVYDVTAGSHQAVKLSGDTAIQDQWYPGLVYVESTDKYYGWAGGSAIYEITPESWKVKVLPVGDGSASPTVAPKAGTYGRFQFAPSKRAFIAVNNIGDNVFVYKLAAGAAGQAEKRK